MVLRSGVAQPSACPRRQNVVQSEQVVCPAQPTNTKFFNDFWNTSVETKPRENAGQDRPGVLSRLIAQGLSSSAASPKTVCLQNQNPLMAKEAMDLGEQLPVTFSSEARPVRLRRSKLPNPESC
jgi:hypothetical protein